MIAAPMPAMANHPAPPLAVSDVDRSALEAIVRASTSEQRAVTRARIVLRAADGVANDRIAAELGVALMTVNCGAAGTPRRVSRVSSTRTARGDHRPIPGPSAIGSPR